MVLKQIYFFTKYSSKGASTRYRTLQYLEFLPSEINYTVLPLFDNSYIEDLYINNKKPLFKAIKAYFDRFVKLLNTQENSIFILENELFPYIPFCLESIFLKKKKLILIYDDAIFHHYDLSSNPYLKLNKNKIGKLMSIANHIIVGNQYLAEYASNWNNKITVIPTVVDERLYATQKKYSINQNKLKVLWLGSPATCEYLYELKDIFESNWFIQNAQLILIGSKPLLINNPNIKYIKWTAEKEIENIQSSDIGIMPLPDNAWARGKCGFKLIQYMLAGLPCIASSVGINSDIIKEGETGFLANTKDQWLQALQKFANDKTLIESMGKKAQKIAKEKYTLQATKDTWLKIILSEF